MTLYYSLVSTAWTQTTTIDSYLTELNYRSSSCSWQRWLCSWSSLSLFHSPSSGSCSRTVDPSSEFPARCACLFLCYKIVDVLLLYSFISENPLVAKLQYGLKITFIFILILFIDSVNRVYRVQIELAQASESNNGAYVLAPPFLCPLQLLILSVPASRQIMGHERLEVQARKFYSQRNMYLCGFTLFLSLILNRTYIMILDVLRLEERVKQYEGGEKNGKQATKLAQAGDVGEIARLKKEIAKRDQDIETLKKQAGGLHKEYNDLSDKVALQDDAPKKSR